MNCTRRAFDLTAFLADPGAPEWAEFREHYPGCSDCAAEVARWTELEMGIREAPLAELDAHPEPAQLAAFDADPGSLGITRRQAIDHHLQGCHSCADELAALRATDFEHIRASAPLSAGEALRQLGRSLSERVRDVASQLAGRAREAAEWTLPIGEPAVVFQAASNMPPVGVLVAVDGTLTGHAYSVPEGESRLGRAPECEVRLEGADLARVEARIHAHRGQVEIAGLNPRLPLRVNGREVERATLSDGDLIELGSQRLEFRSIQVRGAA